MNTAIKPETMERALTEVVARLEAGQTVAHAISNAVDCVLPAIDPARYPFMAESRRAKRSALYRAVVESYTDAHSA